MPLKKFRSFFGSFRKQPKPKLSEHGMEFKGGFMNGRIIAVAPEFEKFAHLNSKVFSRSIELLDQNYSRLLKGKKAKDKASGISIRRDYTGDHPGQKNEMTLRFNSAGKDFFVKIVNRRHAEQIVTGSQIVDDYLRRRGHNLQGINFKIIKPLLVYQKPIAGNKARTYVVTDFYNEGEVKPLGNFKYPDAERALGELSRELLKEGVGEVHSENAFYDPKTKTVMLFDFLALD